MKLNCLTTCAATALSGTLWWRSMPNRRRTHGLMIMNCERFPCFAVNFSDKGDCFKDFAGVLRLVDEE
jgi:hypothetical protein